MGQSKSKIHSNASIKLVEPPQTTPCQEISTPAQPRHLTRISELIDLDELFYEEEPSSTTSPESNGSPYSSSPYTNRQSKRVIVQSPSGSILSPHEYMQRPDRKMTLEERKELIRSNTRSQIQLREAYSASEVKGAEGLGRKRGGGKKKWRECRLGFWGL